MYFLHKRKLQMTSYRIFLFLLSLPLAACQADPPPEHELPPFDGWFNNLVHPDWGGIDGQLLRRSVPKYADGVYHPSGADRPNPFELSKAAHHGEAGLGSKRSRNALLVFFGQQIVEEILDSQRPGCPIEYFNIPVPPDHPYLQGKESLEMPFPRTRYDSRTGYSPNNPRQQLNEITPYIDGTLMYGPGKAWTDAIREFKGGRLKAKVPDPERKKINESFPADNDIRLPFANPPAPRDHFLRPVNRFWRIGNPRGFENPFLLTFGVLFFRWHNYVAKELETEHPNWNDEALFNEARRLVIAYHQKIIMRDWLPRWLQIIDPADSNTFFKVPNYYRNPSEPCEEQFCFNGYSSEIHPGITQEFQTAAMRWGHTVVTPGIWTRAANCQYESNRTVSSPTSHKVHAIRLCNAYWVGQETVDPHIDRLVRGMTSTISEQEDHILVPDLREHLFGTLDFSRRDLAALNIQRARDHGLPGYNDIRQAYGLPRVDWNGINNETVNGGKINKSLIDAIERVRSLYGNSSAPDELDLFVGGMLETTFDGPGPLFRNIILDQFLRIRHGDRFWYENTDERFRQFDDATIDKINNVTLRDIILKVTKIKSDELPSDVFLSFGDPCPQPVQLKADSNQMVNSTITIENCTRLQHYDYFSGSEVSFPLTFVFLGLCVPATIGIMLFLNKRKQKEIAEARKRLAPKRQKTADPNTFTVVEWVGPKNGERTDKIVFDKERKKIHVNDLRRKPLRMLDFRRIEGTAQKVHFRVSTDHENNMLSVRLPGEIDLILKFNDMEEREGFIMALEGFLRDLQINREKHQFTEKTIMDEANTKEKRQELLDTFFRVVCLQGFKHIRSNVDMGHNIQLEELNKIRNIQLTRTEFSEALGLKPTSVFVRNMFLMVDKDKNGFVGFEEFLDLFQILAAGDAEEKAQMIFNMYDIKKQGHLTRQDFSKMLKSLLDLSDTSIDQKDLNNLIDTMYSSAGLSPAEKIGFESFKKIFASEEYGSTLQNATLNITSDAVGDMKQKKSARFEQRRKTFIKSYRTLDRKADNRKSKVRVTTKQKEYPQTKLRQKWFEFISYVENYRLQIFWVTLYSLVTVGIFVERAYYYSVDREHGGLRRIAGYGVTITRGAASVMMWAYSCLLVTMSRNTITFLRETFLHKFIPFDSAIAMHKFIAALALVFTVVHCVGHGINLYHITTQPSSDANCYFREYFRATDVLASFHYWAFQTITGMTGIILTLIVIVMYVFAMPFVRRNLFRAFWITHSFYILLYIFLIMHGLGRLVQNPLTHYYLLGPLVLFVLDKLFSLSRNQILIEVKQAELLPSEVTALKFKRPLNFEYKSGQWVRIACIKLGDSEYHPFTLTSAPHEDFLSLHIRAVGPWTTNLRRVYDANQIEEGDKYPPLYVDGPFGEGHQDWYKYPVAVLVGGGIGVTPFASILKDIVYRSKSPVKFPCQKVYFIWVTRSQKQFEWLTDVIREVETNDTNNLVATHIFITQFQQKFDLRTTMLYICERHFQKIAGKSLFTGLEAKTHFGRPNFQDFLQSLKYEHPNVKQIGVFSCGPPPMTLQVEKAKTAVNKLEGFPTYSHHFENF